MSHLCMFLFCLFPSVSLFSAVFVLFSGDKIIKRFHKVFCQVYSIRFCHLLAVSEEL